MASRFSCGTMPLRRCWELGTIRSRCKSGCSSAANNFRRHGITVARHDGHAQDPRSSTREANKRRSRCGWNKAHRQVRTVRLVVHGTHLHAGPKSTGRRGTVKRGRGFVELPGLMRVASCRGSYYEMVFVEKFTRTKRVHFQESRTIRQRL